jgi:hypothetical protein
LYHELKRFHEWKTPARIEAYNLGAYSFELAEYSLFRIVLVEIAALLTNREERSVVDWLNKAKKHARSLKPTRYHPTDQGSEREPINEKTYRALIKQQEERLASHKKVIDRIKAWRDKAIAHLDRVYFDSPQALDKEYPLTYRDIDRIMDEVSEILRKHHSCLLGADLRMEILSTRNVDSVLNYVRAFQRVRKDRVLIKTGFKPIRYLGDDYEKSSR